MVQTYQNFSLVQKTISVLTCNVCSSTNLAKTASGVSCMNCGTTELVVNGQTIVALQGNSSTTVSGAQTQPLPPQQAKV